MELDSKLIQKKLSKIKGFTFYKQRFDACPHFMFFLGDAHASDTNKSKYPLGQRITCAYFLQNKADWLHPYSELEYTSKKIQHLAKSNSNIAEKMIKEFKPWEIKFYELCKKIDKTNLKKLDNNRLIELYKGLAEIYLKKLNPSPLIDGFALSTDIVLASKLEVFLKKRGLI